MVGPTVLCSRFDDRRMLNVMADSLNRLSALPSTRWKVDGLEAPP